jgi:hypothetical protein
MANIETVSSLASAINVSFAVDRKMAEEGGKVCSGDEARDFIRERG